MSLLLGIKSVLPASAERRVLTSGFSAWTGWDGPDPDAGGAAVAAVAAGPEALRRWSLEEPFPLLEAGFFGAILRLVDFPDSATQNTKNHTQVVFGVN